MRYWMIGGWVMRRCMMRHLMMWGWVMTMMIQHVMVLNNWSNVSMTMHLVMLLVDSMMCAMISHTMTHMMGGGRDCHMVATAGDRGGTSMNLERGGSAQWGEQGQLSMWGNVMWRWEDMSWAQSGGISCSIPLLHLIICHLDLFYLCLNDLVKINFCNILQLTVIFHEWFRVFI